MKRFTWLKKDVYAPQIVITDSLTGKDLTPTDCYDLLNELADENELLKKSVKRQQDSNNECAKLIVVQQKENERLKQDNQRLIKTLDNAANYVQREHREIPLDDFVEWWNNIITEGLDD